MVEQIIEDRTVPWSDSMVQDPVQDRLLDIIKSKKPKRAKTKPKPAAKDDEEAPTNVIDLMSALKKSLEDKPKNGKKSRS